LVFITGIIEDILLSSSSNPSENTFPSGLSNSDLSPSLLLSASLILDELTVDYSSPFPE